MQGDLLTRRTQALGRHDGALARWPNRAGAGFARELGAVVDELQQVAAGLEARRADALERSLSWRYVGDALFDLARGTDAALLKRAADAYRRAERLLDDRDEPVERAKLDFNYAHTLRGLSGGADRALLEEALLRYQLALAAFKRHAPRFAAAAQAALESLRPQLQLLDTFDRARTGWHAAADAAAALARAPDDPAAEQRARAVLAAHQGRPAALVADAASAVHDFSRTAPATDADRLGATLGQLQAAAGGPDNPVQRLLPILLARFRSEVDAGRIRPERQAALEPILDQLQALINRPAAGLDDEITRMGQLRELMTRMTALLAEPSTGQPPPAAGSRAARLFRIAGELARQVAAEHLPANLGAAERETATQLFTELAKARAALSAAVDAGRTVAHERDLLRPLAQRVGQFALRHHAMLATPFWALAREPPDPSAVYVCGGSGASRLVDALAPALALRAIRPAAAGDVGQARFNAIAAGSGVVCDLRLAAGPEYAAACYEIGLARALGRPVVIAVGPDDTLPFDIDSAPVVLRGEDSDREALADAIDAALYAPPHREADSSLAATLGELQRRYGATSAPALRKGLELAQQAAGDPIEARHRIESVLGFVGPDAPRLVFPAWPGAYPSPGERRLFHVTPFSRDWSDAVRDAAAAVCRDRDARYVRGDAAPDPRVIRSIWDEICRASHVLVDLTDFNANVALELGLAHGLGRHALIVGQGDTVARLFPAIRKVRVLPYSLAEGGASLSVAVERFLAAPAATQ